MTRFVLKRNFFSKNLRWQGLVFECTVFLAGTHADKVRFERDFEQEPLYSADMRFVLERISSVNEKKKLKSR